MTDTLRASRAKPSASATGAKVYQRASLLGDAIVTPSFMKCHQLADEGSYFIGRNATPGTALAGHPAATTFDPLKPLITMFNPSTDNVKRVFIDYIKLYLTNAGTAGTTVRFTTVIDAINRRTSAGTAIVPINPNMADDVASCITATGLYFGPVVAPAADGAVRVLYDAVHRPVIGVVGDTYQINYGAPQRAPQANLVTSGTAVCHTVVDHGPVVIGPGDSFLLYQWSPSQSGAYQFEFEMGWWER